MDDTLPGVRLTGTEQVNVITTDGAEAIEGLPEHMTGIARQIQSWLNETRSSATDSSIISRDVFQNTKDVFGQMRAAREIMGRDDIISNALEVTEGLAFQGVKWESEDELTQDVFNQMAAEQNLDDFVRKAFREEFSYSQFVCMTWWDKGTFSMRGETENGNKRKGKREVWFPRRLAIIDSAKVVPVGSPYFGMEQLAWVPSKNEMQQFERFIHGDLKDDIMDRFWTGKYTPAPEELQDLRGTSDGRDGIQVPGELILLSDRYVKRHTLTRSDYERWAPVRLKSVFHLVDMKQQLMAADRVALVGAANYILLVKKGDKDNPAHQEEITNLKANFKLLAKIPVVFSDHRLTIEIITPKQDFTLQAEKYDLLDRRILQRLLNALPGGSSGASDGQKGSAIVMGRSVSRALEGRRHMLKRWIEKELARAVVEHPRNEGIFKEGPPSLTYSPNRVILESDAALAQQILSLRTQKELSRESTLEFFGYDQAAEAMRRIIEEEKYDDIFQTTVPFSAPGQGGPGDGEDDKGDGKVPADQAGQGAKGGRPLGGGKRTQNPTKTSVTDSGNGSTKKGD